MPPSDQPPPTAEQLERAIRLVQASILTVVGGVIVVAVLYAMAAWK